MHFIEIDQVGKRFGSRTALDEISLHIDAARRVVLLGPSGAGKTTLLRILAGLEIPDQGKVTVEGKDILSKPPHARGLAMVSQDYALYPQLSLRKNLETALRRLHLDRNTLKRRIDETLEWFEIDSLASQLPSQLSGGEAQRAALAKAVATRPKILLLDEPLSQVDGILKVPLTELIRDITVKFGCSTLMVTHDPLDAMKLADEIVMLNCGCLLQQGTPAELYQFPKSKVAASLLSPLGMNWFDLESDARGLVVELHNLGRIPRETPSRFVGFRPEAIVWSATTGESREKAPASTCDSQGLQIQATLTDVQNLGFARLILAQWQGHRLRLLSTQANACESSAIQGEASMVQGTVPIDKLIWVDR